MGPGLWGLAPLVLLLLGKPAAGMKPSAAAAVGDVCFPLSLLESLLPPPSPSCSAAAPGALVVEEGDEAALRNAMHLVRDNKDDYVAFLFYASWCPFSKDCRSNFNILQSLFPNIRHFAFEESAMKRSILSKYGVHGFPTLFLLNSTMRIRYHGPRRINLLTTFYEDVTGSKPVEADPVSLVRRTQSPNDWDASTDEELENCPFSWAKSPEKLLQQDTCLALATVFVILRLLHFLWPRLIACCHCAWKRNTRSANLLILSQACLERGWQACMLLNPCNPKNQQGARSGHGWASPSLVPVPICEGSSRRGQMGYETR